MKKITKIVLLSTIIPAAIIGTVVPLSILLSKKNDVFYSMRSQDGKTRLAGAGDKITFEVYANGKTEKNVDLALNNEGKEYAEIVGETVRCKKQPYSNDIPDIYVMAYKKGTTNELTKTEITIDPTFDRITWNSYQASMSVKQEQYLKATSTSGGKITYEAVGKLPVGISFDPKTGWLRYVNALTANTTIQIKATSDKGDESTINIVMLSPPAGQDNIQWEAYQASMHAHTSQTIKATSSTTEATVTLEADGILPDGVTFDTATGILSYGHPLQADTNVTLRARSSAGAIAEIIVTMLKPAPAQDNITWNKYNSAMSVGQTQKIVATSSTAGASITYAAVGAVPTGVTFDATTGTISYQTAAIAADTTLTVSATSSAGATASITITFLLPSPVQENITWGSYKSAMHVGDKQTITATSSKEGATITLSATPTPLPTGVTFNPSNGELAYNTAVAADTNITITATSSAGATAAIKITILPVPPTPVEEHLTWDPYKAAMHPTDTQVVKATSSISEATVTLSATGLPGGVTFTAATGTIAYTTAVTVETNITIKATSNRGATAEITIAILPSGAVQENITWGNYESAMHVGGKQILSATSTDSTATITFGVEGATPPGVTFNTTTRELAYNTAQTEQKTITIVATSNKGAVAKIIITFLVPTPAQENIAWGSYKSAMHVGDTQTITATSSVAGARVTLSTVGTVPSGVHFEPTTGVVSYSTAVATDTPLVIRATSNRGAIAEITITILKPTPAQETISWSPYKAAMHVGDSQVITATSSITGATLTYTTVGTVPTGVSFNDTTRTITYTTAVTTETTLTIKATSTGGTNAQIVIAILPATPAQENLSWSPYKAAMHVGDSQIVTATSSVAGVTITYTTVGTVPTGVTFNAATRTITYSSAVATETTLTIKATSNGGANAQIVIAILPASPTQDNISWASYSASMAVGEKQTLAATSSAGGNIAFSVVGGTPEGVTFNTTTGELTYGTTVRTKMTMTIKATSTKGGTAEIEIAFMPAHSEHSVHLMNAQPTETDYYITVSKDGSERILYFGIDNSTRNVYYSYVIRNTMQYIQVVSFDPHHLVSGSGQYWGALTLKADPAGQGQTYPEELLIIATDYSSGETYSNSTWISVYIPI